jgi:hypothetical protein
VDALRVSAEAAVAQTAGAPSRGQGKRLKKEREPFVQLPLERGIMLYRLHLGDAAWAVLMELTYLAFKGENPVRLNSGRLKEAGVSQSVRAKALRRLEGAGLIKVEPQGIGKAHLVTLLWCRLRD